MKTLHYALLTLTFGYSLCQGAAMPLTVASSTKAKTEKEKASEAKQKLTSALMMQNIAKHRKLPIKTTEELKKEQAHAIIAKNASNNCIIVRHAAQTDPIHIAGSHVPAIIQLIKSYWGTHDLFDHAFRPAFATTETLTPVSLMRDPPLYNINGKLIEYRHKNDNDTFIATENTAYWRSDTDSKTWNQFVSKVDKDIIIKNCRMQAYLERRTFSTLEISQIFDPRELLEEGYNVNSIEEKVKNFIEKITKIHGMNSPCDVFKVRIAQHKLDFERRKRATLQIFYHFKVKELEVDENNDKHLKILVYFFKNEAIVTVNTYNHKIKIWNVTESHKRSDSVDNILFASDLLEFCEYHRLDLNNLNDDMLERYYKATSYHAPIKGYMCHCIQTIDYSKQPFTDIAITDITIDANDPCRFLITTQQAQKFLYSQNQDAMKEITQLLTIDDLIKLKALIETLRKIAEDQAISSINLEQVDKQFFDELPTNIRLTILKNYPKLTL